MNDDRPIHHVIRSNGFGTAGFVLSLVAIATCGILSPIGLILSIIGLFKQPRGMAAAGTVLGTLGSIWMFTIGLTMVAGLMGLKKVGDDYKAEVQKRSEQSASAASSDRDPPSLTTSDVGPPIKTVKPTDSLVADELSASSGDIEVRLKGTSIDIVPLHDFSGNGKSEHKLLMVRIQIGNKSTTKKLTYTSWSSIAFGDRATLRDEFDNHYAAVNFGITKVVGQAEQRNSIYPQKSIDDLLVFEVPTDSSRRLKLTLPGSALSIESDLVLVFSNPIAPVAAAPTPPSDPLGSAKDAVRIQREPTPINPAPLTRMRLWTSSDGKFKIVAEYVSKLNDKVRLKRQSDGTVIEVQLEKFSDADRAYVGGLNK